MNVFLKCKYVLCHHSTYEVFLKKDQYIEIDGFKIVSIKDQKNFKPSGKIIDLNNHIVSPGFINTHTHIPMSLFRGLCDDRSLFEWLNNYILPVEKKFLNPKFVKLGAQLGALECLYSGITTVADMYHFGNVTGDVFNKAGLRGFFDCCSINDDNLSFENQIKEFIDQFKNHERIYPALTPHSPYTCSDKTLEKVKKESVNFNLPIFIHASETKKELEDSLTKYKKTPVERLHALGLTGSKSLFVHCVHLKDQDQEILSQTKTSVSYNPKSNMKLCSGIAPICSLLDKKIKVGLGTDGVSSNNNLNFISSMNIGLKLQKTFLEKGDEITASHILGMATLGGAECLNLKNLGQIKEGYLADLIAINIDSIQFRPQHNLISHLVYSAYGNEIEFVMVHGKVLLQNRQQNILDESELFHECENVGEQMRQFLKS